MDCILQNLSVFDKCYLNRYSATLYHFLYNFDNSHTALVGNGINYFKDDNQDTFLDWRNTGCWQNQADYDEGAHRLANDRYIKLILSNVANRMRKLVYAHLYDEARSFAKQLRDATD